VLAGRQLDLGGAGDQVDGAELGVVAGDVGEQEVGARVLLADRVGAGQQRAAVSLPAGCHRPRAVRYPRDVEVEVRVGGAAGGERLLEGDRGALIGVREGAGDVLAGRQLDLGGAGDQVDGAELGVVAGDVGEQEVGTRVLLADRVGAGQQRAAVSPARRLPPARAVRYPRDVEVEVRVGGAAGGERLLEGDRGALIGVREGAGDVLAGRQLDLGGAGDQVDGAELGVVAGDVVSRKLAPGFCSPIV
jgi:hypothetical protein